MIRFQEELEVSRDKEGHQVEYCNADGQYHGDLTSTSGKVFHAAKEIWVLDEWQDIHCDT